MKPLPLTQKNWFEAAQSGDVEQLRHWHRKGDLTKQFDPSKVSAIVSSGRPRAIHLLDKEYHDTAFHAALRNYSLSYARVLLDVCSPEMHPNKEGEYPLHILAQSLASSFEDMQEEAEAVLEKLLALNHPLNPKTKKGETPLNWLLRYAHSEINIYKPLQMLIDRGASFDREDLLNAIRGKQAQAVDVLLTINPKHCLKRGPDGENALHTLASAWTLEDDEDPKSPLRQMMRSLLLAGEDPHATITDTTGKVYTMKAFFEAVSTRVAYQTLQDEVQAEQLHQETPAAKSTQRPFRL